MKTEITTETLDAATDLMDDKEPHMKAELPLGEYADKDLTIKRLNDEIAGRDIVIDMWDKDFAAIEVWLHKNHPEFVTNSGKTAVGELLSSLGR